MPERTERVECLGLLCPEPVLRTAKAARALGPGGGLLEIYADDDAFPLDLKSWVASANAELVSLDKQEQSYKAIVRVKPKAVAAAPVGAPPTPTSAVGRAAVATAANVELAQLDYRGLLCPEPIMALAKAVRGARQPFEVLADDPAFPLDLESWCRSSGVSADPVLTEGSVFRVVVFPKGVSREMMARTVVGSPPGAVVAPAPSPVSNAPQLSLATAPTQSPAIVPAVPAEPASPFPAEMSTARFDLRSLSVEALDSELENIGRLRPGTGVTLLLPPSAGQRAVRWCAAGGHDLQAFNGGDRVDLVLGKSTAGSVDAALTPARSDGAYDCALLVMHNDLETLLGALLVANSAAAAGMRTMIFFTFWGLNLLRADQPNLKAPAEPVSFMQRMFKWMMPKGPRRQNLGQLNFGGAGAAILQGIMSQKKILDLEALLSSAREQNVSFIACTMSMSVMGIGQRDLEPFSNLQLGGVATFVEAARYAKISLVF